MRTYYLAPVGNNAALTSISLGTVRTLERLGIRAAFIKPVADNYPGEEGERSVGFAQALFNIKVPKPISIDRVEFLMSHGLKDQLMEEMVAMKGQGESDVDLLVVEGLAHDPHKPLLASLNGDIARNLQSDVILVVNAEDTDAVNIAEQIEITVEQFGGSDRVSLVGYVLTRVPSKTDVQQLHRLIAQNSKVVNEGRLPLIGATPYEPSHTAPRMLDVANHLNAKILFHGNIETARVRDIMVATRSIEYVVERLRPGALVITAGDRDDVLIATSMAVMRGTPIAGLLLTSGFEPKHVIKKLCAPALMQKIPVLLTEGTTYETVNALGRMDNHIPGDDIERATLLVDFVADHLNGEILKAKVDLQTESRMPPAAFRYQLMQAARKANKRIVLPEGDEPRTVKAAVICHQKGIARCVLLGDRNSIEEVAEAQGVELPADLEILNPDEIRHRYVMPLAELRKSKGMTPPQAEQHLEDNVVMGTMMIVMNEVDGLVSGAVHTTANTIRPALQLIKTAPGASIVSSVFFMLMPDQVYVYGDCAVNPDPTAQELADIAIQSADSAKAFGISPRVAMISYSTGSSGAGADVEKVAEATRLAKGKRPDLLIDGPLQYDAASVESVGRQKSPGSPVAGRANVFVFPDLNTGNTTYKAVQRSANVVSVGPMLQGLRRPVNDLSRGALVDDIVYTIALTAIQATQQIEG
ncbi:MAG: phosphate acetyltransferase [Chitinophagaceae bacterium]|nr:phosphate acetyltransferase [Chitinophagaceae bacterium]